MKLGQQSRRKLGKKQPKQLGGWAEAIADAERKIGDTKSRLSRLKAALNFCRESLASGEPFPGDGSDQKRAFGSSDEVMSQDKVLGQSLPKADTYINPQPEGDNVASADKLIRVVEDTGKQIALLGRTLRRENEIAKSDKRKKAVGDLLVIVEACDSQLAAGLRSFEDQILK